MCPSDSKTQTLNEAQEDDDLSSLWPLITFAEKSGAAREQSLPQNLEQILHLPLLPAL